MKLDLAGKRVVVCGGSRGIGRATVLAFAQCGATVSTCARNPAGLDALRGELAATGSTLHTSECDLSRQADIERYLPSAADALGGIDILINNASGFGFGNDEAAWQACIQVDLLATVRASAAAERWLTASPAGSIVNVSSIAGFRPSARTPAYAAIKAAIVQYTSSQAALLARRRVRVNCVAPGSIEFPGGLWDQRRTTAPALHDSILKSIPFGRLGAPEEVANLIVFLASPLAGWITGQTVAVDGGQLLGA
ncbi:MAG: SDR family NAD(P)-dependent oxidoreductase [Burkholderiales bacterium]